MMFLHDPSLILAKPVQTLANCNSYQLMLLELWKNLFRWYIPILDWDIMQINIYSALIPGLANT